MVTLLTEKLRSQTLQDVQFEPIPQLAKPSTTDLIPGWTSKAVGSNDENEECFITPLTIESNFDHGEKTSQFLGPTTRQRHASLDAPRRHAGPDHGKSILSSPSISSTLFCDNMTPPAPPLKRHCRSLSIPGDLVQVGTSSQNVATKTWQPQASTIWKPVALRPHFRESKLMKSRHSPLSGLPHQKNRHSSGPGNLCSVTPRKSSPSGSLGAPGSADSGTGHNSTEPSCFGLWSVASSDSFSTPPESPIPRPASASSGFYDSSQSSLNAPWLDSLNSSNTTSNSVRVNTFKVRSFSMEEPISYVAVPGHSTPTAGSMPVIPGSVSTPSSPRRYRVPRCRSQPCDLHDRKCGLKRRRDDDRPTLDFFKMKETAYDRTNRVACGRLKNVQFAEKDVRSGRILPSIFSEPPECFLGLNTIASSPLDNVLPALSSNAQLMATGAVSGRLNSEDAHHPKSDHRKTSAKHVGCFAGDVFPELKTRMAASQSILASSINNHDRHDAQSGSESEGTEAEDGGNGAGDPGAGSESENAMEQVFQLDMNTELDLEQIEKD